MTAIETPSRILISRLSAIGDCVLTTPIACALRDRFPSAFIAWAVEPAAAQLLQGHPAINELIVLKKGWLKSPREIFAVRKRLRDLKFDTTIDPQSLTKSSLVAWLSGARRRIGFAKPHGRELSPWLNTTLVKKTRDHVVDHQLELLIPLGISDVKVRFDLPGNAAAEAVIDAFIRSRRLVDGFVAINPGAGWDSRLWPTERYARVARHLGEKLQTPSVVTWAGDREREWAEEIVGSARGYAILAPKTNLVELLALLRRATLYVGSDTGPLHMSVAAGTKAVSLHGTTRHEQSGPYGSGHIALQAYYQEGSSRQRRTADNVAMRDITVESVCDACDQQLVGKPKKKAA